MHKRAIIIHGTEGYPEENWFPWLKSKLENSGYTVTVPQFPSPPVVPAKLSDWFEVIDSINFKFDKDTIIIGHSLGGVFTLRVLETLKEKVRAAFFIGTPVGIKPILNYDRDAAFGGFEFNWEKIKDAAEHFDVFQSDDDPYVDQANGYELAKQLSVALSFVPNAGHFNKDAGYIQFPQLMEKIEGLEH